MKQFIILFTFTILVVNAYDNIEAQRQWHQFKSLHQKLYTSSVEETTRFQVFQENLKRIEEHNAKYDAGLTTWKMGVTQFADMTPEEFVQSLKTNRPTTKSTLRKSIPKGNTIVIDDEIDWRKDGAVSPVKNLGDCGCTLSVAATGGVETQYYLKRGEMELFSDQALTDCSPIPPLYGCHYVTIFAYMYLVGITRQNEYSSTCGVCNNTQPNTLTVNTVIVAENGDENQLAMALKNGTIVVSYQASANMMLYASGVLDDDQCEQIPSNMGLLVVGYGSENGTDYWIARNSWGESWGEKGYLRTTRNKKNRCGIANEGYLTLLF